MLASVPLDAVGIFRRTAAVAASLAALLLLLVGSPAGAHGAMESSDPTAGAVIDDPVSEVTLVFSDQTEPVGDGFQVVESDGGIRNPNAWESADGRTFVLHFDPPITGGETGLQWTIRSADSHALNGSFSFTVDAEVPIEAESPDGSAATVGSDPESDLEVASGAASASESESESVASPPTAAGRPTIESVPVAADPIPVVSDAELNGSPPVRALGLLGRLTATVGSLVAVGAVVFLVLVLRGTPGDGRLVLLIARRAALLVVAGTIAQSVATVAVRGGGWAATLSPVEWMEALSSRFGSAAGLLLIGAFGISSGSQFRREPIGHQSSEMIRADMTRVGVLAAGPRFSTVTNHPPLDNADEVGASLTPLLFRWHPTSASSGAVLGVVSLLAAAVVGGHTLGGPGAFMSAIVTLAHVVAGSVWVGGVVVLLSLLRRRLAAQRHVEAVDVAVRFSVLAAVSLVGVALAGMILTYSHVDSISQLWTTGWGRLVLGKLGLVAVAAALGAMNHFVVIPRLVTRTDDVGLGTVLKRLISAEIVVLVTVLALTAQLVATGL